MQNKSLKILIVIRIHYLSGAQKGRKSRNKDRTQTMLNYCRTYGKRTHRKPDHYKGRLSSLGANAIIEPAMQKDEINIASLV